MEKFADYQAKVNTLLINPERGDLELLCGQLCSEAGEVFGQLTKIRRLSYKIQKGLVPNADAAKIPEMWEKLYKELGDVQFYLAAISNEVMKPLDKITDENIEKLEDRKRRDVLTNGQGDNR